MKTWQKCDLASDKGLLLRDVMMWWHRLALSRAARYRDFVALVWEVVALSICFILYMSAILAIFLTLDREGRNPSTY